jgi:hypothetical protein
MKLYFSLLSILLLKICQAQGFRVRHYLPGVQNNTAKAIFETSPGNYITGGIVVESVNGISSNRLCVMGLGSQGQILWQKKYGNSRFEYLDNVFISRSYYKKDNFMYYTGCVLDSNNKNIGVLIKFNLLGDTIWQRVFRDVDILEDVIPQMVTKSADGGFLITGFFQNNSNTPYSKCMLIKTDANGNELWRKKLAKVTPNVQDGKSIIQDSSTKKIVITGYQYINGVYGVYDNVMVLDSAGNLLVRSRLMGTKGGTVYDMIQTKDKKIVMVGLLYENQTTFGYDKMQSFIAKFDLTAPQTPLWKIDNFDKLCLANTFKCLTEDQNGNLLIAGGFDTLRDNNLNTNILIRFTKINSSGSILSNVYYDYKINESWKENNLRPSSIELTSDGGWVMAIESLNFPSPNPFFFVKYDANGCDSTLAYCQAMSVGVQENKWQNNASLDVYPNPAHDFITFKLPRSGAGDRLCLSIADLSGRELKNIKLADRQETYQTSVKNMDAGIYLLRLFKNGELVGAGKLVKEK